MTTLLQAGNGTACDGDEFSGDPDAPITSIQAGGHLFPPGGRYEVKVCDDDESGLNPPDFDTNTDTNGRVRVVSKGYGQDGAEAVLEMLVGSADVPAISVDGDLRISGAPTITGENGIAHANGDLELLGDVSAEQFFGAAGTVTVVGTPSTGPPPDYDDNPVDIRSGEEPVKTPALRAPDLRTSANTILGSDGIVRDQSGGVLGDANSGPVLGWSWDSGGQTWRAGDATVAAIYYAEGNIDVNGSPGTLIDPLTLSLIAEGWIVISGTPTIFPLLTTGGVTYTLVAGTDLSLISAAQFVGPGLLFARDQIDISGSPTINGQVIAANEGDEEGPGGTNLVSPSDGFMVISGNPSITEEGTGVLATSVVGWRECNESNASTACN